MALIRDVPFSDYDTAGTAQDISEGSAAADLFPVLSSVYDDAAGQIETLPGKRRFTARAAEASPCALPGRCDDVSIAELTSALLFRGSGPGAKPGRYLANGAVQAGVVIPVDPIQGFPFDLANGFPGAEELDDRGFEQADDAFGEGIVTAVADTANRGVDAGLCEPLCVSDRQVLAATKARFTLSSGQVWAASGLVVITFLPRTTPCNPMICISLSTVQRAMSRRSRRSWCQTLRAPYRPRLPSKTCLIAAMSCRSCLARSDARSGSRSTALKA